jgi:hypothetical protein
MLQNILISEYRDKAVGRMQLGIETKDSHWRSLKAQWSAFCENCFVTDMIHWQAGSAG